MTFWKTTLQAGNINGLADSGSPKSANNPTDIATIRAELAAWSERQPKPARQAARFLDGWLMVCADPDEDASIDVLACTARAVETLRRATGRA